MASPFLPPRLRKFLGLFILLAILGVYIWAAVSIGSNYINPLGGFAQFVYYVLAGTAWAIPVHPLMRWMLKT